MNYRSFSGSTYVQLPVELKIKKKKRLTNILCVLVLKKYIQKELHGKRKNLLMILIMMGLGFLCKKNILARSDGKQHLQQQTGSNLRLRSKIWKHNGFVAYNWWKQVTLLCTSKISTDLCFTKQKIRTNIVLQKLFTVL